MAVRRFLSILIFIPAFVGACRANPEPRAPASASTPNVQKPVKQGDRVVKSKEEWKKQLSPEQYRILREKGTERAFTGDYYKTKTPGVYRCAGCGAELFLSDHKFESGSGWPSFYQPAGDSSVEIEKDTSHFMVRTEVHCRRCGGHLGHVFEDGPKPTGLRYCINSASLQLEPKDEPKEE